MPSFDDFFGSNYLKAEDLAGREVTARIARIQSVDMKDGKKKLALFFEGKKKALLLNKTNATKIASGYGQNFDDWTGKPLVLYPDETMFGTEMVPCLRVRVPPAPPQREPGEDDNAPDNW